MKKLSKILLFILAFALFSVFAIACNDDEQRPYTEGLSYKLINGDTEYEVIGIGTATDTDIYIPVFYEGKPVTTIGYCAFFGCTGLTSITIPSSVTSIGYNAFWGCTNLIQKENGVSYVDKWVVNCDTSVTSVTLRADTVGIADDAFRGCAGLESITVGAGNTVYHSNGNCLIETSSKTLVLVCKNSVIPTDGSVTSIGAWAFHYRTGLTSITIPDSVTSIGFYAFSNCTGLTSITIPDSITSIGGHAFSYCTGLTSVTIPNSVTSIGEGAFYNCTGLTSITIPNSVTNIDEFAFSGTGLTSITIPNSVTNIDDYAFAHCTELTDITYQGTKAQWNAITKGSYWNSDTGNYTIHCTDGDIAKY